MSHKEKNIKNDPILKELDYIKRLLVLILLKAGASQKEVASTLGVNQSTISRIFKNCDIKLFDQLYKK